MKAWQNFRFFLTLTKTAPFFLLKFSNESLTKFSIFLQPNQKWFNFGWIWKKIENFVRVLPLLYILIWKTIHFWWAVKKIESFVVIKKSMKFINFHSSSFQLGRNFKHMTNIFPSTIFYSRFLRLLVTSRLNICNVYLDFNSIVLTTFTLDIFWKNYHTKWIQISQWLRKMFQFWFEIWVKNTTRR